MRSILRLPRYLAICGAAVLFLLIAAVYALSERELRRTYPVPEEPALAISAPTH